MLVRLSRFLAPLLAFLLWSAVPAFAQNSESILDFHSDLALQQDSSLQVTETITVFANGNQIRHGIFRDFPTDYRDALGNHYSVGFQLRAVTYEGYPEKFRIEERSNGKRIYIGDPQTYVPPGRHTYTITYLTNRQLGYFKDHDELFWNVTGLGWNFPIQHASATVHLPDSIPSSQVKLSGFTGPQGSLQSDLTAEPAGSGFQFAATRVLHPHEGLTILLMWPKGFFAEPTASQKLHFFFQDNRDALILVVGLLLLFLYYSTTWSAVGRDPQRGVIVPLYEPPQSLSPAAMRYLLRMGFDNKTFAAAILDMAVRGFLTIKEQNGSYTLYLTGKSSLTLPPDEQQIAASLFDGRNQIWLHQENHQTIGATLKSFKKFLANAEQKTYFVTNSRYLIAPIVLSLLIAAGYLLLRGVPQVVTGAFLAFWLTGWTFGLYGIVVTVLTAWKAVLHMASAPLKETPSIGKALFLSLFGLPFLFFEVMAFWFLFKLTSFPFVLFVLATACLHVLFFHWMKAPTLLGRRLMDQAEGFKMFLGAVDGDRLNRTNPPEQTPAVFEKFLPYALALDVEQDWAEKFSGILATAGTAPGNNGATAYTPSFYSGGSWNGFTGSSFASSFGSSLTSAISSSATAPGSGGGGGSGGSGGGGGGGGGGGW